MSLSYAAAQQYPFSSFTVNSLTSGLPSPTVIPSFPTYHNSITRFAVEVQTDAPFSISLTFTTTTGSAVSYRQCNGLSTPTSANGFQYCSATAASTVASGGTTTAFNLNPTAYFFEFWTAVSGIANPPHYTLTVNVISPESNYGTNMFVLEPVQADYVNPSSLTQPSIFSSSQSQFTVAGGIASASSNTVTIVYAAQQSVYEVGVNFCAGTTCDNCAVNTASPTQINIKSTTNAPTTAALQGTYTFGANIGYNCVRFVNLVTQPGLGTNAQTYTVNFFASVCAGICSACIAIPGCGWCGVTGSIGTCMVGTDLGPTTGSCAIANYYYFAGTCPSNILGDPQIKGLQGQDFQVHGMPNEYFNLVSGADVQVNGRFVYLTDAKCDNFTACFSHAGTYIDEVGVMFAQDGAIQKVRVQAQGIDQPSRVFINGNEVTKSAHRHSLSGGKMTVNFALGRRVIISTPVVRFVVSQSDKFFNIETQLLDSALLNLGEKRVVSTTSEVPLPSGVAPESVLHGLIGQTWRNIEYPNEREYEGDISDYQLQDGLWGKQSTFNLFKH